MVYAVLNWLNCRGWLKQKYHEIQNMNKWGSLIGGWKRYVGRRPAFSGWSEAPSFV